MEQIFVEFMAKHGPFAVLLGIVLFWVERYVSRQTDVNNAQRNKEIDSSIKAAEKELEILALRHDAATEHEKQMEQVAQDQSRLLERISTALERLATTKAPRD